MQFVCQCVQQSICSRDVHTDIMNVSIQTLHSLDTKSQNQTLSVNHLQTRITELTAQHKLRALIHWIGWLVGRLTSPFSTKIGYIGNKVLGSANLKMTNDTVTSQPRCLFCSATTQNGKGYGRLI